MLGYEGREAASDAAAAEQRLAAARLDAADADAELARAQAEGPASHRKRDYIDKVSFRGFKGNFETHYDGTLDAADADAELARSQAEGLASNASATTSTGCISTFEDTDTEKKPRVKGDL